MMIVATFHLSGLLGRECGLLVELEPNMAAKKEEVEEGIHEEEKVG